MTQFRGLWIPCLLSYMACLWTGYVEANGLSCSKSLGIGTPAKPVYALQGSAPQICVSEKTCCTNQMENTLRRKALAKMKASIVRKLEGRKDSTRSLREDIKGYFKSVVQDGHQHSLQFLSTSNVNLSRAGRPLLARFFQRVELSIDNENVNLTDVVLEFFGGSFPLLYKYASGRSEHLSSRYEKCLRDRMEDIQPFGDHPKQIANGLIEVIKPVQVYLDSLTFAMKIIDGSRLLSFTTGCDPVLLQMTYCSLCKGLSETLKPCHQYCLEVMEKCLAPTLQLQKYWKVYFESLDSLASSLAGEKSVGSVMTSVYKDLSTAVAQVLTRVNEVKRKAYTYCGTPQYVNEAPSLPSAPPPHRPTSDSHLRTPLESKMEGAKSKMLLLNTLFGELPSLVCVADGVAAVSERKGVEKCWNGTAMARYIGPLSASMDAFQIIAIDNAKIRTLVSEMKQTIKTIQRHTRREKIDTGSGSGEGGSGGSNVIDGSGCDSDDDDCASGSGKNTVDFRGDGRKDDGDFYLTDTTTANPNGKPTVQLDGGVLGAKNDKRSAATTAGLHHALLACVTVLAVLILGV